jgi:ribosomal protein L29
MPTKKTTKPVKKETAPKKSGDLKTLRAELFSLKMKHSLRELKEVHKLREARRAIARHLTKLKLK